MDPGGSGVFSHGGGVGLPLPLPLSCWQECRCDGWHSSSHIGPWGPASAEAGRARRQKETGSWHCDAHTCPGSPAYFWAFLMRNRNKLIFGFLTVQPNLTPITWPLLPSGVSACGPSLCLLCSSHSADVVSPTHQALPRLRAFAHALLYLEHPSHPLFLAISSSPLKPQLRGYLLQEAFPDRSGIPRVFNSESRGLF